MTLGNHGDPSVQDAMVYKIVTQVMVKQENGCDPRYAVQRNVLGLIFHSQCTSFRLESKGRLEESAPPNPL